MYTQRMRIISQTGLKRFWQGSPRQLMLHADRNGIFYVLDRATGEFLLGKPFVKVNWTSGFDAKGKPIRALQTSTSGIRVYPGNQGGTNWYNPAFNPRTGLFYVPAWEETSSVFTKREQEYKPGVNFAGGGFTADHVEKATKAPIKNEAGNGVSNKRGTLAMARTPDPDSASAQFFINVIDNNFLDRNASSAGYAVFGKVIDGMDVVDKIKAVKTGQKSFTVKSGRKEMFPNSPLDDVIIKSVKREK